MKRSDQDELLKDILGDGSLDAMRQASLARGLEALRRRQQRRRGLEVAAAAVVALLVMVAAAFHRQTRSVMQTARQSPAPPFQAAASHVHYINQEELFALFPNRPMAIIGKPGHQQVIFLDELARQEAP